MSKKQLLRPGIPRTLSSNIRQYRQDPSNNTYGTIRNPLKQRTQRTSSELEHLLEEQEDDDEHADSDGLYPPHCSWVIGQSPPAGIDLYGHDEWPIYNNIHRIRNEIINSIDDPYSIDQLKAPRLNIQLVRPLVQQWYHSQDLSIVYCLLVNRMQFIREQSYFTHHQTVNLTRALLCELVAEKILRRYNEDNPGPKGLLKLANILVAGFEPFQKAPEDVVKNSYHFLNYVRDKGGKSERTMTALEVAIVSESKSFLASSACQKVVDAIYRGKLVYTPNSFIDILPDYWKKRPISLYDPRRGPLLNQYRLAVPRTRNIIEIFQFLVLLGLYLAVMESRETRDTVAYTLLEMVFDLYAWGWVLDQVLSMLEHGWSVYTQNLWSFLDVIFSLIYVFYFATRMYGMSYTDTDDVETWSILSLDVLSCAAPILIPRLAFNLLSENLVFLCLRDMLANFITLVLLASWCFVGFLLTLKWLHNGLHRPVTIGKWMIWIWFGLDGTGIDKSAEFHWLLGPAVTIAFAFLGNTLFVTILVSMLSNTFSKISNNAVQEMQYRRSVLTFEGVKADALFAFMPPVNVLALFTLLPLKFVLSPRWFHKVNVFSVRIVNAPLLLIVSLYERRTLWISNKYRRIKASNVDWTNPSGPVAINRNWWSRTFQFWALHRFNAHGDMQAVFEDVRATPFEDDEHEEGIGKSLREGFLKQFDPKKKSRPSSLLDVKKSRPGSSTGDTLKQEFLTDSDDADNEGADAPEGHRRLKRRTRKDSMADLQEGSGLAEANIRLQKLEESVEDIHGVLRQLLDSRTGTGNTESAPELLLTASRELDNE